MSVVNEGRRELQLSMVEALQVADFNGIALASTGIGKAWVLIECLKRINPKGKIWYLCDSELNRDETFRNELIKWGAKKWIDKIEFMCYQTAYKLENESVEVCLCDEFDMACTTEYIKAVQNNKFKHLIMVSATLKAEKRELAKSIRLIVYEIALQEVEDKGLLNKSRYHEVNFLLTPKENLEYLRFSRTFSRLLNDGKQNYKALEMLKIQRRHFLASLKSSEVICKKLLRELIKEKDSRIIVFCGLSKQADKVCKYSYHSKSVNNALTDFHEGRINIVAVVGKVDRGANVGGSELEGLGKPINCMVFEAPVKSSTKFLQKSGRGRRLQPHEMLDVYFLIPYFKNNLGKQLPTIVKRWIRQSTASIDYKPINYRFK